MLRLFLLLLLSVTLPAYGQPRGPKPADVSATGYINALAIGLRPDVNLANTGASTDNYPLLQHYLDSLPPKSVASIYFPAGGYYFSRSILVHNGKSIDFRGVQAMPYLDFGTVSRLFFGPGESGIMIVGGRLNGSAYTNGALTSSISDLGVIAYGSIAGKITSGIYHEVICNFSRVYSEGFGWGFRTVAEVAYPMNGNSSLSVYLSCRAVRNREDGFCASGPDANAITYLNCVAVENWGWGFLDSSLLGNFYYGCQTATNGRMGSEAQPPTRGGGFGVFSADAHGMISGCYSEGDQLPNYISPANNFAVAIGGIHANGWCGNLPGAAFREAGGSVQKGNRFSRIAATQIEAGEIALRNIYLRNSTVYGQGDRAGIYDRDRTPFLEVLSDGVPQGRIGPAAAGGRLPARSVPGKSMRLYPTQWIGGELQIRGDTSIEDVVFSYGDKVINDAWAEGRPDHWRVIRPGRNHRLKGNEFSITSSGPHDTDPGLRQISLDSRSAYALLRVGDVLNMADGTAQIWAIDSTPMAEVRIPAGMRVREGEPIDWMGGWIPALQPVGYSDSTIMLPFTAAFEPDYQSGANVVTDGLPTTLRSVTVKDGMQLIEINLPDGLEPGVFRTDAHIGWSAANINRTPAYYDHTDPKHPTVTIAFPTAALRAGATVWINGTATTVQRMIRPAITVRLLSGRLPGPGSSFRVQRPGFKAVGF